MSRFRTSGNNFIPPSSSDVTISGCIDSSFFSADLIPSASENDTDTQVLQDTLASRVRKTVLSEAIKTLGN
tara:strand:- start:61 stop:273 length:213 start_codon:yes stop_codon:yes gene_type:complete